MRLVVGALEVLGAAALLWGLYMIHPALALVVGGAGALALALVLQLSDGGAPSRRVR